MPKELEDDPCNETNLDANDQSIQGEYNGNVMGTQIGETSDKCREAH